ncbi:hypothetical protein KSW81_002389 [Nannochloris sp. 'desiccata']|nr:hypothetical protein KSW81_002389 [Chlorella desiccata (nom. nud.)]
MTTNLVPRVTFYLNNGSIHWFQGTYRPCRAGMAPLYSRLRHPTRRNCQHAISLRRQRGKLAYPSWYGSCWFILAFHFFVWFLVAVFLFSRKVHMARSMLTSLLAVAATLLMFTANTWYRVNGVGDELDGTFKKRARTALAGAAIAAAANFMLLMVLGLHDEKDTDRFEKREEMGYRTGHVETTVPVSATRTTGAPASTATAV